MPIAVPSAYHWVSIRPCSFINKLSRSRDSSALKSQLTQFHPNGLILAFIPSARTQPDLRFTPSLFISSSCSFKGKHKYSKVNPTVNSFIIRFYQSLAVFWVLKIAVITICLYIMQYIVSMVQECLFKLAYHNHTLFFDIV